MATYREKLEPLLLAGRPPKYTSYNRYTFVVDGSVTDLIKEADEKIADLTERLSDVNDWLNSDSIFMNGDDIANFRLLTKT